MTGRRAPALLVLEDGTTFRGVTFGAEGETVGEAVFNTGMTGYQETLTDPSYCRQIVAMTAPHIGNTGINDEDGESGRIWVSGFVIREPALFASSWRSARSLEDELAARGVVAIAISGTRALTLHLRERGAMRAAISSTESDPASLLERVLASPPMTGADLAGEVTTPRPYVVQPPSGTPVRYRVAAVDLGIKTATPLAMARLGCEVRVLPVTSTAAEILAASPDGVFFSNGPGDPAAVGYAIDAMSGILAARVPLFGICLGSQILGRALGLATYKLRFGHRGVNQPVKDLRTGRVQITSHNHGFAVQMPGQAGFDAGAMDAASAVEAASAVDAGGSGRQAGKRFESAFGAAEVTHVNLNDGVVEGLRLLDAPAFAVQYHPEAAPGPHDAAGLFGEFCALMEAAR
ncbi:MAG TPA: glutamine-hydrolyzing carbamoyl-phosphate synthase small subunit [Streptosporangiaceae bacterium]|nr:glutamine-hydrolyzing carbamoyl-phosphate synthase small subunit [Streptosporangiaceae bacterium]